MKKVDIIIPAYNSLKQLKLCIDSIYNNTDNDSFQLCIINNSPDNSEIKEMLDAMNDEFDNIIIYDKNNIGWVGGINYGIEVSDNPYVVFLNDDIIVSSGWLDKMLDKFNMSENVGAVGAISNAVAGKQHIAYNRTGITHEETPFLIGFCMMVRRDVLSILKELDGYYMDDIFNNVGSDDIDISMRIRDLGFKLIIARDVYVHHFWSGDTKNSYSIGNERLLEKWGQEKLNKMFGALPKIYIAIPSATGVINHKTFMSILTTNIPYQISFSVQVRTLPDVARNLLIEEALTHGFSHILFIDDDMVWDDRDILVKLIAHNVDIVGAQAHTRLAPFFPCVFSEKDGKYQSIDCKDKGLTEVGAIGASFLLIKTEALRQMGSKNWFGFLPINLAGIDSDRTGEDISFCRNAKNAGFKIYCDGDIQIGHIGLPQIVTRDTWDQYNKTVEDKQDYIHKMKIA